MESKQNEMKDITLAKLSIICLFLQTALAEITFNDTADFVADNISIISFVIIVVANWSKVKAQVRKWTNKK